MSKRKYEENNLFEELGYNFTIEPNSIERPKTKYSEPEKEFLRSKVIQDLHNRYDMKCKELFYFKFTPKDSLNRFLLEQLSLPETKLIQKPKDVIEMDTIDKEIKTVFCLTCKLDSNSNRLKLNRLIKDIIFFAKQTLKNDYYRLVNDNNLSELLNLPISVNDNEFLQLFKKKRSAYKGILADEISSKILNLKQFLYKELTVLTRELKKIENLKINKTSKVEIKQEDDYILIRYKDLEFKINKFHFKKLNDLYLLRKHFNECLFVLICRYQTYFRVNEQINEGYGMQAALPKEVFEFLNKNFGVTQEIFASPFNCYFKNYNSAFNDIDSLFGSSGSFFDYEPVEGSFEANPPFTEEVIERMADRIDYLLSKSNRALSFIVFIPEWLDPPTPGLVKMEKSKFLIKYFNVEKDKHKYVSGSQYVNSDGCLLYKAVHNTRVFILQNEAGTKKWTVNDEKIQNLKKRMQHL